MLTKDIKFDYKIKIVQWFIYHLHYDNHVFNGNKGSTSLSLLQAEYIHFLCRYYIIDDISFWSPFISCIEA